MNVVLDDAVEILRRPGDPYVASGKVRKLGLVVCRGPAVMLVAPCQGLQEIANPFEEGDDDGEGEEEEEEE